MVFHLLPGKLKTHTGYGLSVTVFGLWFGADSEKMDATVKWRPSAFPKLIRQKNWGGLSRSPHPLLQRGAGDKRANMTHKSRKK
jgi:hypothetical protein